jgi:hypothetical protein
MNSIQHARRLNLGGKCLKCGQRCVMAPDLRAGVGGLEVDYPTAMTSAGPCRSSIVVLCLHCLVKSTMHLAVSLSKIFAW